VASTSVTTHDMPAPRVSPPGAGTPHVAGQKNIDI
jgi:hypothetical protein